MSARQFGLYVAVLGADGPTDVGFLGVGPDKSGFSGDVRGIFWDQVGLCSLEGPRAS